MTQAEIEASMGNLALFRGEFDEALKFLESSRRKYESLKMPHQEAVAELEIADIYLELNLSIEAFEIYEKLTETLARLKMQGEEARARANFGRVAILGNEKTLARRELKKAAKLYPAEKNLIGEATVKLNEASSNFHQEVSKNAENCRRRGAAFRRKQKLPTTIDRELADGEALRNLEKYDAAEMILKKTFAEAVKYEQPSLAQSAQNRSANCPCSETISTKPKRFFESDSN